MWDVFKPGGLGEHQLRPEDKREAPIHYDMPRVLDQPPPYPGEKPPPQPQQPQHYDNPAYTHSTHL